MVLGKKWLFSIENEAEIRPLWKGRKSAKYLKISITAHALIEAHSPVWTPKMSIFKQISQKVQPLIKAHPRILKKNRSYVMQTHLKFVISSNSNELSL